MRPVRQANRKRDRFCDSRQSAQRQDIVDPVPTIDWFTLAKKVRFPSHGRIDLECIGGLQMRFGRVFDIDVVDQVRPIADLAKLFRSGTLDDARD